VIIRSRAPLRVSFGGGGTDVAPYLQDRGGAVLSTTIDKYAYCSLRPGGTEGITIRSLDYDLVARFSDSIDLPSNGELLLPRAVAKRFHLNHGVEMVVHCDAPPGSGLGSSSAMTVAMVGASKMFLGERLDSNEIAETAFLTERNDAGIQGGKQDQYAAAFGGFNFIEFNRDSTSVQPLALREDLLDELQYRLMLCYTGLLRPSGEILRDQVHAYESRDPRLVAALDATKEIAYAMRDALRAGTIDRFGALMNEAWHLKRSFSPKVTDPVIDRMYEIARNAGAMGGKLLGAGGGGFLLLLCDGPGKHAVAQALKKQGGQIVPFRFEKQGLRVWTAAADGAKLG
jgi:D-glycero-alpha-D-manno-heptose-7-phosphate kinase